MQETQRRSVTPERRSLGIYYTPPRLANAISDWIVREHTDIVLEPSFGGCHFVGACLQRLRELGSIDPATQLFGYDIDEAAFRSLWQLGIPKGSPNFTLGSFLSSKAGPACAQRFDAIVGNPPFVRQRKISPEVRAQNLERHAQVPGTASLWAHFLDKSLDLTRPGGRLGMVLPSAFSFVHYAKSLRERLAQGFQTVHVLRLNYQCFASEGAQEKPIILLADGDPNTPCAGWQEWDCLTEDEVVSLCRGLQRSSKQLPDVESCTRFKPLSAIAENFRPLGEIATIKIGIVTGANNFFVVDDDTVKRHSLPASALNPLIPRSSAKDGIVFTGRDHARAVRAGRRVWLFSPPHSGPRHGAVRKYLATMPRTRRRSTLWFRKRKHWYQPELGERPDAVVTYMNHHGARLIMLNKTMVCTNSLHRLYLRAGVPSHALACASLSFLTTYTQLSAEKVGRSYGGGVLKLEPSEAAQLSVIRHEIVEPEVLAAAVKAADKALRAGDKEGATRIADETLLRSILGDRFDATLADLARQLGEVRANRLPLSLGCVR